MTFTADNLPEAARSMPMDPTARFDNGMPLNLNGYTARVLNRLDAAHGYRLSKLLNGAAAVETASPTTLPEWAKATADDLLLMAGKTFSNAADPLNYHAARVLARMPVQTLPGDEVERAAKIIYERAMSFDRGGVPAWQERGNSDAQERARDVARDILARESHCQKPADQVRFALEKVTDEDLGRAYVAARQANICQWFQTGYDLNKAVDVLRTELARILPVAEPGKPWAELTAEDYAKMYSKAVDASCLNTREDWSVRRMAAGQVLRECFEAYAPPPRKVEVTPEVVQAYGKAAVRTDGLYSKEPGFEKFPSERLAGLRAALAVANDQAETREIEAVAELARLRTLIGDDNIAALSEGSARIIPANQAPGMPNAKCHACGIGDYCGNEDCPNAAAEIKRLKGEVERLQMACDNAETEVGRLKAYIERLQSESRDADTAFKKMNAQIERLTKERDEAQKMAGEWLAKYEQARDSGVSLRQHADKLEALLTVPGVDGPVKTWLPFERCGVGPVYDKGWEDSSISRIISFGGGIFRQSPAPEAEPLKRWKIANADTYAADVAYFVTVPMTRADAETRGEVIGEAVE